MKKILDFHITSLIDLINFIRQQIETICSEQLDGLEDKTYLKSFKEALDNLNHNI